MSAIVTAISQYPAKGLAGQRLGVGPHRVSSFKNNAVPVAKVVDVLATAQNTTAYTLKINGITISVTSDGSGTAAEVRDLLLAAIAADAYANALVTVAASGANCRITERNPAAGEVAITEADANLTLTVITAHGEYEPMAAGIAVARGDGDREIRKLSSGASVAGITVHSHAIGDSDLDGEALYDANSVIPVLTSGMLLVKVEEAVTPADDVYVRHTATTDNPTLGAFRTDSDGGTAMALASAAYRSSADADELAEVEVNAP